MIDHPKSGRASRASWKYFMEKGVDGDLDEIEVMKCWMTVRIGQQ